MSIYQCLSVYLSTWFPASIVAGLQSYGPACLSVFLSVCLSSFFLSVCLSEFQSVCLSVCLSVSLFVYLSVCLSVYLVPAGLMAGVQSDACLSVFLSVCLSSFCLSVCLSVRLSVCLSICLSVCLPGSRLHCGRCTARWLRPPAGPRCPGTAHLAKSIFFLFFFLANTLNYISCYTSNII